MVFAAINMFIASYFSFNVYSLMFFGFLGSLCLTFGLVAVAALKVDAILISQKGITDDKLKNKESTRITVYYYIGNAVGIMLCSYLGAALLEPPLALEPKYGNF